MNNEPAIEVDFNLLTRQSGVTQRFSCDASDLRWPPGMFAKKVRIVNRPQGELVLLFVSRDLEDTHQYESPTEVFVLRVYND